MDYSIIKDAILSQIDFSTIITAVLAIAVLNVVLIVVVIGSSYLLNFIKYQGHQTKENQINHSFQKSIDSSSDWGLVPLDGEIQEDKDWGGSVDDSGWNVDNSKYY